MPKVIRDNGLTIVLMLMFLASLAGHWLAGWSVENEDLRRHGDAGISLLAYLGHPAFISSIFENWESEFLQMAMYVMLTSMLYQRGSSESNDPDKPLPEGDVSLQLRPDSPSLLRSGPTVRWLYAHSLGLTLLILFLVSSVLHWTSSAKVAADEAREHGEKALGAIEYLGDSQLWFESFQNWQSEFLSTAVLVVLSIFLRQKNSPESKPVAAPHRQTGP